MYSPPFGYEVSKIQCNQSSEVIKLHPLASNCCHQLLLSGLHSRRVTTFTHTASIICISWIFLFVSEYTAFVWFLVAFPWKSTRWRRFQTGSWPEARDIVG